MGFITVNVDRLIGDCFILSKALTKALGPEASLIYSYLLDKRKEAKVSNEEFFSVNLSRLEKNLGIKRRKKELALATLCNESLIEIMRRELRFSKDVRISIIALGRRCNILQDNALTGCNILQDNALLGCNLLQDNALEQGQRDTASMYSFNILKYINVKSFVGINSNSSLVRKSILKFLKSSQVEKASSDLDKAPFSEAKKRPEMNSKTKTNTKPRPKITKAQMDQIKAEEIILYLNEKTKKNFKVNAKINLKFINARLKENYKIEDFKKVIDLKVNEWAAWPSGQKYLRPQTLFSDKFDSYLNETEETSLDDDLKNFFEKNDCTPV